MHHSLHHSVFKEAWPLLALVSEHLYHLQRKPTLPAVRCSLLLPRSPHHWPASAGVDLPILNISCKYNNEPCGLWTRVLSLIIMVTKLIHMSETDFLLWIRSMIWIYCMLFIYSLPAIIYTALLTIYSKIWAILFITLHFFSFWCGPSFFFF